MRQEIIYNIVTSSQKEVKLITSMLKHTPSEFDCTLMQKHSTTAVYGTEKGIAKELICQIFRYVQSRTERSILHQCKYIKENSSMMRIKNDKPLCIHIICTI